MPNARKKKIIKQGFNYIVHSVDAISDFFKTRWKNLDTQVKPGKDKKRKRGSGKKKFSKKAYASESSDDSSSEE